MSIGTSLGAFYEDSFHQAASEWDPKFDGNLDPSARPDGTANDANVVDSTVKTQDFQTKVGWVDDLFGSLQAAPTLKDYNGKIPHVVPDIHSLLDSQQFPEDGIGRLLGKEGPRWDRFREDEPGPMESAKQDKKVPVEPEDKMERKPSDVLGIDPTNDNNVLPMDILYKRPGGLIHQVANLTNTPDEIMSGLEGVRVFPRGVAGPTQMRNAANSNNHNPELDSAVNRSIQITDELKGMSRSRQDRGAASFSEFEQAKWDKLVKEHRSLFPQ